MNANTNHRNPQGRFLPGHPYAAAGGRARAARLSPERRREIARAGFAALVKKRFAGDKTLAARYLGEVGAWAGDGFRGTPLQHFDHPGSIDAWLRRRRTTGRGEA